MDQNHSRRTILVARLADHVLAQGLGSSSLRPLAAAVGTSDRMLLYYFPDKATLIATVLEETASRMMRLLEVHRNPMRLSKTALENRLLSFVLDDAIWPFMQLWLEIASLAARGDQVCSQVGGAIARGFLDWTTGQLSTRDDARRRVEGTRVLTAVEGAILLKSLGLGDAVAVSIESARSQP